MGEERQIRPSSTNTPSIPLKLVPRLQVEQSRRVQIVIASVHALHIAFREQLIGTLSSNKRSILTMLFDENVCGTLKRQRQTSGAWRPRRHPCSTTY
jgi:hypothetical protein